MKNRNKTSILVSISSNLIQMKLIELHKIINIGQLWIFIDSTENKKMINILVLISSNSIQIKLVTFSESMCSYETNIG